MVQPLISCAALSAQRSGLLGDLPFEPNQFCNLTEPRLSKPGVGWFSHETRVMMQARLGRERLNNWTHLVS
jgi:hypothetical protein